MLVQHSNLLVKSKGSLEKKKKMVAQNNISKHEDYLNSVKIFKQEIEVLRIKIHVYISDKNNLSNSII